MKKQKETLNVGNPNLFSVGDVLRIHGKNWTVERVEPHEVIVEPMYWYHYFLAWIGWKWWQFKRKYF